MRMGGVSGLVPRSSRPLRHAGRQWTMADAERVLDVRRAMPWAGKARVAVELARRHPRRALSTAGAMAAGGCGRQCASPGASLHAEFSRKGVSAIGAAILAAPREPGTGAPSGAAETAGPVDPEGRGEDVARCADLPGDVVSVRLGLLLEASPHVRDGDRYVGKAARFRTRTLPSSQSRGQVRVNLTKGVLA